MAIKKSKKGFAFSFLSLFLVILIYYYASIQIEKDTFTSQGISTENRILSIDSEIRYFENSYLKELFEISSFKTIESLLLNSLNQTFYLEYRNNYSKLNELISEGIINASFNGKPSNKLNNYSVQNLTKLYLLHLEDNYFIQSNFTIENILIYEEKPLFLTIQADFIFNFSSLDNISNWNFNKTIKSDISIYKLYDSTFFLLAKKNISSPKIDSIEQYSADLNWSLDLFNETLINQYSTIFYEPTFKYTLGNSYLSGLFNTFTGPYKNLIGFWSFDYDEEENGIYDSSREHNNSYLFGNTKLLLQFENISVIRDLTDYNNSIFLNGAPTQANNCAWVNCLNFDGSNDYVSISNSGDLVFNEEFSFSIWFNTSTSNSKGTIFSSGMDTLNGGLELVILENATGFNLSIACNSNLYSHIFSVNLTNVSFNSIIGKVSIPQNSTIIHLNGLEIYNSNLGYDCTSFNTISDFNIGADHPIPNNFFEGQLDEVILMSNFLNQNKIGNLYFNVKGLEVDYTESFHGKGIIFEQGEIIILNFSNNHANFLSDDHSIGIWFKPEIDAGNLLTFDGEYSIGYNTSGVYISDNHFNPTQNIIGATDLVPVLNRYNHIVITYNSSSSNIEIYLNGEKANVYNPLVALNSENNGGELILGSSTLPSAGVVNSNFIGVLDEVYIHNKTLTEFEIQNQYYNFKSSVKGCCNYLIPVNPNLNSYDSAAYSNLTSYSSRLFFNYYYNNITYNVTLYSVLNLTSFIVGQEYYNFLFDQCMVDIYDIYSYLNGSAIQLYHEGDNGFSCEAMIKEGLY